MDEKKYNEKVIKYYLTYDDEIKMKFVAKK